MKYLSKPCLVDTIAPLVLLLSEVGVSYMALTAAKTAEIIKTYQHKKGDTGSSEVQIALLTARISYLTEHMKSNTHDFHTRHGLTKLVSQRRRLLNYLKKANPVSYRELITKLDVRGN